MARERGSKDKAHYEVGGGRIEPSPGYGDDSGFDTPAAPGERGEAYGEPVGRGSMAPKKYDGLPGRMKKEPR